MLSLAALASCNSIVGFDDLVRVDSVDAGSSSSSGSSSGASSGGASEAGTAPRCDPSKDFAAPTLITALDGTDSTGRAIMTPDELEIFYLKGDSAPYELRHAIRTTADTTWDAATTETLDPDASELGSLAVGGLKLYYWHIDETGALDSTPVEATREQLRTPFGAGTTITGINRAIVALDTDDAAYWSVYNVAGADTDEQIFRGIVSGDRVANPVPVTAIHVAGALDDHPALVGNQELTIYFESTRDPSNGGSDIWRATRTSAQTDYGTPTHVDGVSSSSPEAPSWVSADDCVMLLDRLKHFYIAQRPN